MTSETRKTLEALATMYDTMSAIGPDATLSGDLATAAAIRSALAEIDALTQRLDDEAERSIDAAIAVARKHSRTVRRLSAGLFAARAQVADLEARAGSALVTPEDEA